MSELTDERQNIFDKILRKQYLISEMLRMKLDVVTFIVNGYQQGKSILVDNKFLHFTAQMYYRNAAIDLTALFDKPNKQNRYSFFQITKYYTDMLFPEKLNELSTWLEEHKDDINTLVIFRHNEAAHYNFETQNSLQLNTQLLPVFNRLFELTIKIISFLGDADVIKHNYEGRKYQLGKLSNENMFSFNLLLMLAKNEIQLDNEEMNDSEELD